MARPTQVRTQDDLDRVGRALGEHFKTDVVVVVGSQSVLVGWPDAPEIMRTSSEIDAYPANYLQWQEMPENKGFEASEEINALFGDQSTFEETHGFFIDGVDANTARLPFGWQSRAVFREIQSYNDKRVTIIAPSVEDMAVSKLTRLVDKDKGWLKSCHDRRPLDKIRLLSLMSDNSIDSTIIKKANDFLATLPSKTPYRTPTASEIPNYDSSTHCVSISGNDGTLFVRAWDEEKRLYHKVDNHLGPAVISKGEGNYFLDGKRLSYEEWKANPRVQSTQMNGPT